MIALVSTPERYGLSSLPDVSIITCGIIHFLIHTYLFNFHFTSQPRYKDPKRGDVSFAIMLEEKAAAEERDANPKPGSEPGCAGCKN